MTERTLPWWHRALKFALGGIVGLFRRNGNGTAGGEVGPPATAIEPEMSAAFRPEAQKQETDRQEESRVQPSTPRLETVVAGEPFSPDVLAAKTVAMHNELAAREAADIVAQTAPEEDAAEVAEEPSVKAAIPAVQFETPPELAAAEEPGWPDPAEPCETTPPAEAASAEEVRRAIEVTAVAAREEDTAPEPESAQEEETAPDGMENNLPEPAQIGDPASQEATAPNQASAPKEEEAQHAARDLESESAQTKEKVLSEEVTEPTHFAAPEAAAATAPEAAAEQIPEEATAQASVNEVVESSAAESEPVPTAGPVEPPPIPAPAPPEPQPAPQPAPAPVDAAPTLPFAEKPAARTTAEKVAAALKAREARGEDADQSPFSVLVNQVYDGPLDLLLDLIRKQDIDIYDIPIAKITAQFLAYVDQLRASDMDVAGEFIYTAALLIHIKSKMLLPRAPAGPDDAAEDPRRELVERLLEHERFKNAAQMLLEKQMLEAATWSNPGVREFKADSEAEPEIAADTTDLVRVFSSILERARNRPIINVEEDSVTVGQMIQFLARRLTMEDRPVALRRMLSHTNSERALIAMFLALLELVRLQAILLRQDRHFSEIFIKKHTGFDALMNQGLAEARDDWR